MKYTHKPVNSISDGVAYGLVKFFRFFADTFFAKRYGNPAIVLETACRNSRYGCWCVSTPMVSA